MAKHVYEDYGASNGRTRDWPAIPGSLSKLAPVSASTSIVCSLCGSPYGGLIYNVSTEEFQHRGLCKRT